MNYSQVMFRPTVGKPFVIGLTLLVALLSYYWTDVDNNKTAFVDNKPTSQCKLDCLKSNFVENGTIQIGKGETYYKNGDRYVGEFMNGLRHGKGTYYWTSGDRYSGDWVQNQRIGKGEYQFQTGNIYVGDFYDGQMHGNGQMNFSNGERYSGEFLNDYKHGKGTYYWTSGARYIGVWIQNQRTDKGERYSGDWYQGQRTGKGEYYWANGQRYVGDFYYGHLHGNGKMLYSDGARYSGDWVDDQRTGKGEYVFRNGDSYVGEFLKNNFHGKGKMEIGTKFSSVVFKYECVWIEGKQLSCMGPIIWATLAAVFEIYKDVLVFLVLFILAEYFGLNLRYCMVRFGRYFMV